VQGRKVPIKLLGAAMVVAALASSAPLPALGARDGHTSLISASVANGQTIKELENSWFRQTVTCSQRCDVTTVISISLSDARKLGFKGTAASNRVMVASSWARLKANRPTQIPFVVSADGKTLLAKAQSGLAITGTLIGFVTDKTSERGSAGWRVSLK
jgi:hypothetical protein